MTSVKTTSKPVSTICYTSAMTCEAALVGAVSAGLISRYAFIAHKPEADGLKPHIHIIIYPVGRLNLDKISITEPDPNNAIPLGCMPWAPVSSPCDFYLYSLHNPEYLAAKGLQRKYVYEWEEFHTNFTADEWQRLQVECADYLAKMAPAKMTKAELRTACMTAISERTPLARIALMYPDITTSEIYGLYRLFALSDRTEQDSIYSDLHCGEVPPWATRATYVAESEKIGSLPNTRFVAYDIPTPFDGF